MILALKSNLLGSFKATLLQQISKEFKVHSRGIARLVETDDQA